MHVPNKTRPCGIHITLEAETVLGKKQKLKEGIYIISLEHKIEL